MILDMGHVHLPIDIAAEIMVTATNMVERKSMLSKKTLDFLKRPV